MDYNNIDRFDIDSSRNFRADSTSRDSNFRVTKTLTANLEKAVNTGRCKFRFLNIYLDR